MGFRLTSAVLVALVAGQAAAFMPHSLRTAAPISTSARHFGVDPSTFQDLSHQIQHMPDVFSSSLTLSDAMDAASSAVQPLADAAEEVATGSDNGWFGFLTEPIQLLLQAIHSGVMSVSPQNSWGISIIALTVLIKVVTFPLTKTQLESTNKMQALQPKVKEIQAKYESNPEVMNQKVSEVYQNNEVNPLAGCLPSLVQIPVFIGLYRAVLDLAKENKLDEGFFFLPNLEGPTYGADPAHGTDWLFQGWIDGVPALGWTDTISFLILPVFLVISQFISMELMTPKDNPTASNPVLKILPVMIGWFALNVPAALSVYWVINNIVTTATTLAIRNSMEMPAVAAGDSTATVATPAQQSIFTPPREKPAGFGDSTSAPVVDSSGVKTLTSVVDAEIEDKVSDGEVASEGTDNTSNKKKRGKKRKKKNN